MADHITDEMVDAAQRAYARMGWAVILDDAKDALAAALDAAPAVDQYLYVNTRDNAVTMQAAPLWACCAPRLKWGSEPVPHIAKRSECEFFDCPGPHRVLILGPEVTP